MYARVINKANAKNLGDFMRDHIHLDAEITTDRWSRYTPLKKEFNNLNQIYSGDKGGNFSELHRVIMNLKGWLRDVHHYVKDLQDYLDEYSYRFNRSFMKEAIFENLMIRVVKSEPYFIKKLVAKCLDQY